MTHRIITISEWRPITTAQHEAMMREKCRQDAIDDVTQYVESDDHDERQEAHGGRRE